MYSYHLVMDWVLTGQSLSLEMFRNWFLNVHISILPKSQIFGWDFGRVLGLVLGQALGNG